jgi:dTDP-glucose 4,6-dehydratase
MKTEASTWSGRSVLVTGAGGFIGSHLVQALATEGARVRAFLRYNSRGQEGNLKFLDVALREKVEMVYGDLRDSAAVHEASMGVEVVFHLAASISIPYSYIHPREVIDTNVGGALNVLMAARDLGVTRVVLTSTSEVYGTAQYVPIDERHPLQPQSPYAGSKVAADMLGLSFYRTYECPVAIVRPFNTYGPRQSMRAVIPTIITQALTQDTIRLGALHPTRDFLYVEDTVRAFMHAACDEKAVGEVINFGYGTTISIGELAEQVVRIVDRDVRVESVQDRYRPETSEVLRLEADRSKAERLLGWVPKVSLREGLARTVRWVSEHLGEFDPKVYYM